MLRELLPAALSLSAAALAALEVRLAACASVARPIMAPTPLTSFSAISLQISAFLLYRREYCNGPELRGFVYLVFSVLMGNAEGLRTVYTEHIFRGIHPWYIYQNHNLSTGAQLVDAVRFTSPTKQFPFSVSLSLTVGLAFGFGFGFAKPHLLPSA